MSLKYAGDPKVENLQIRGSFIRIPIGDSFQISNSGEVKNTFGSAPLQKQYF